MVTIAAPVDASRLVWTTCAQLLFHGFLRSVFQRRTSVMSLLSRGHSSGSLISFIMFGFDVWLADVKSETGNRFQFLLIRCLNNGKH